MGAGIESALDHDVVIVGGGPTGCSAGVFLARYGFDTVIFDRGRSSIQRCAHLENYLGFPAGIDIETLYGLMHDQAERAGCAIVSHLVESVERVADGEGFRVELQDGESVTARRVVAATRYDGGYLRSLLGDEPFVTYEHDGEVSEYFSREYAKPDGRLQVDGIYIASPSDADTQAILAAGRGAHVAVTLLNDALSEQGMPESAANHYDWVRQNSELDGEWDEDRWHEWFDDRLPDDHDLDERRYAELREVTIDWARGSYIGDDEAERRAEQGQRALLAHLDDDLVLERAAAIVDDQPDGTSLRDLEPHRNH